jgi:ankyrin repeat protein
LAIATIRGDVSFAAFLLEQGADPNAAGFGFTPLHWVAGTWQNEWANSVLGAEIYVGGIQDRQGKLELAKALLDHGADPNAQITRNPPRWIGGYTDKVGATPFILASFASDLEMMRLLHAAGADPKQVTGTGSTSLMAVSGINKRRVYSPVTEDEALEAAQFVLDLGVDPAWENRRKDTALHGPAYLGWDRLVQLLVESGAKVNAVNRAGTTPYLAASGVGDRQGGVNYNESTAELLIELGADPDFGAPCQAQGRCRNLSSEVYEKVLSGEIYSTDPRYGVTDADVINSNN